MAIAPYTPKKIVDPREIAEIVDAHNKYRTEVATRYGVPALDPLAWSEGLANEAQKYATIAAEKMIKDGILAHDPAVTDEKYPEGENLACYTPGFLSLAGFVDQWGKEKMYFVKSPDGTYTYPNVSAGGEVGHYTQIVWRDTTLVGCGRVITNVPDRYGKRWDVLAAHYFIRGNIRTKPVF